MAFAETRAATSPRTIMEAKGVCNIPITETILAGDCLGISGAAWVLSASATVEQPLLVAIQDGVSGDTIEAAILAIVKCTTTSTNVATVGELVCVDYDGAYKADTGNYPDCGFVTSIGSDSLSAVMIICPLVPQLTTARA